MKKKDPTVEEFLRDYLKLPGAYVTEHERNFVADMRHYAALGVGYGWMQQMIEVEWKHAAGYGWGPQYHETRIKELEEEVAALKTARQEETP